MQNTEMLRNSGGSSRGRSDQSPRSAAVRHVPPIGFIFFFIFDFFFIALVTTRWEFRRHEAL
jgi:hypothetical protein